MASDRLAEGIGGTLTQGRDGNPGVPTIYPLPADELGPIVDGCSSTHIGHTAAEIARPTAAIRSITATALPRKHSFDASQQPFALNPWSERA
jgi:hypothetical protein